MEIPEYPSLPSVKSNNAMSAARLTSKGQITLPKSVRDRLHLVAGDRVEFIEMNGGFHMRAIGADVRKLKSILPPRKTPVSLEQMQAAIRQVGSGSK